MESLRNDRTSWWTHWRDVAEYTMPRRSRFLITPNQQRGGAVNRRVINECAVRSAKVLAAGLMSGVTSPSRPWFKLTLPDMDVAENSAAKLWLDTVEKRMSRVLADSNYYTAKATQYLDLVVFGTAPLIIYEDEDDIIHCYNPVVGEYFCANGKRMDVETLAREYVYSVSQTVDEFGIDNCSAAVRGAFENGGASLRQEVVICHLIEPNNQDIGSKLIPKHFTWRETYWERGSSSDCLLRCKGFNERPFSVPRWDVSGNDAYGWCPGMEALGGAKHLQFEELKNAEAMDKGIDPPLIADASMRNEPMSSVPGGISFAPAGMQGDPFKPVYQVNPVFVDKISADILRVEERIKETFYVPLFRMISEATKDMTAYEVARRQEEKLIELGPVLERNQNEGLDPDIDRVFAIMSRAGLFPPAPPELHNTYIKVEYVSMLAATQRAASTAAIERLAAFAGNLNAADPTVLDNLDLDEMIEEYADALGTPAKVLRDLVKVQQMRATRAHDQQQQQMMQQTAAGVQGAQTLSQTDVGGGQNALAAMLGNAPSGAGARV